MFNVTEFKVGEVAPAFRYNDKNRAGVVESIQGNIVKLKYQGEDGKLQYRSFDVAKMQPVG